MQFQELDIKVLINYILFVRMGIALFIGIAILWIIKGLLKKKLNTLQEKTKKRLVFKILYAISLGLFIGLVFLQLWNLYCIYGSEQWLVKLISK